MEIPAIAGGTPLLCKVGKVRRRLSRTAFAPRTQQATDREGTAGGANAATKLMYGGRLYPPYRFNQIDRLGVDVTAGGQLGVKIRQTLLPGRSG